MYVSRDALDRRASELRELAGRTGRVTAPDAELGHACTVVAKIALLARRLGIDIEVALDTERPLPGAGGRLPDHAAPGLSRN